MGATSTVGPVPAPPARPAAVLVLVPELGWADAPPFLAGWAKASLSLRSARSRPTTADGYLTIGKGNRTAAPPPGLSVGPVAPAPGGGVRLVDWNALTAYDRTLHYPGRPGALGQALAGSGRRWALAADDPQAAAAVADLHGRVARALPGGDAVAGSLAAGADILVVETPLAGLPSVAAAAREACVVVASASSPDGDRHLGVLAASPPCGLGNDGLSSDSTHQRHLATILDVGPTFLDRAGVSRPGGIGGAVVRPSGPVSLGALVQADRKSFRADRARTPLVWLFIVLTAIGAAVALLRPRARPAVAYLLLAVPPASFGVMAVPWWRWGTGGAVLAGSVAVAGMASGAALLGRRDVALAVGALAATTAVVVGLDAVFGGKLEIDAPFGNSPIVGGRYYGVGNIGSGFLAAGIIVVGALALERWGRRALPAVVAAMAAGVVVGGAPWFGADVGGVLFAVPAFGILLAGWRRGRPTARLVVPIVVATLAVLALFAAADLARPSGSRSHLGREVAGNGLLDEGVRKAGRALATVKNPFSLVLLVGVATLAAARPRLSRRPPLHAAAWALVVAAVIGSAANDSGLLVGASVTALAWPAFLALAPGDPTTPGGVTAEPTTTEAVTG